MVPVNFRFQAEPSAILVQFRDEDRGVNSERAIAIVVCRESDQKYLGSTGMDAHMAAFVPGMLSMGTNALLALRRNGEEVGRLQLVRADEGGFSIHVELPEVVGQWDLSGKDFADLSALFRGEVA